MISKKVLTFAFFALIFSNSIFATRPDRVPNEYVIAFQKEQPLTASFYVSLTSKGIKIKEIVNSREKILRIYFNDPKISQNDTLKTLRSLISTARIIEPNYLYYTSTGGTPPPSEAPTPPLDDGLPTLDTNDPHFTKLWGLKNQGQADSAGQNGFTNADIGASKIWSTRNSAEDIVVAIIDTGVDYTHPDLAENMWKGKDPQGNIIHGFNAISDNYNPMDDNKHGTHVAGTIGAVGNNGIGVVGIAWKTQIMAVKFLSSSGSGNLADAVQAIDFAIANNADVMNNSWGSRGAASEILKEAVERSKEAGIVFVAAAGNDGASNDGSANQISYPASYKISNVISVGASDNQDRLARFSNFGKESVHVMAPGVKIFSTTPNNQYNSFDGTSMASPHVTGAVALLLQHDNTLTPEQVKERVMTTADKINLYTPKLISAGRLNVYNLIQNKQGSAR